MMNFKLKHKIIASILTLIIAAIVALSIASIIYAIMTIRHFVAMH